MPTYVYECRKCERVFEVVQRMVEDPLTDCECGAKGGLRRVIQPAGVVFRGSGFHINDYAGQKADSPPDKDTAPSVAPAAEPVASEPAPTPTETKPEAPKTDKA